MRLFSIQISKLAKILLLLSISSLLACGSGGNNPGSDNPIDTSADKYYIEGYVLDEYGNGIPDVRIACTSSGYYTWRFTDEMGFYKLSGMGEDSYTLTPLKDGYSFVPNYSQSLNVPPSITNMDFIASVLPSEAEDSISQSGGIIEVIKNDSSLYGVKIEIPEGSVEEDTDIYVLCPDNPPSLNKNMGLSTPIVNLITNRKSTFSKKLTVTIPIDPNQIKPGDNLEAIRVYYSNRDGEIIKIDSQDFLGVDIQNMTVSFMTDHFTHFFGIIKSVGDIWGGEFNSLEGVYYEEGMEWLEKVSEHPEFWNSVIGDTDGDFINGNMDVIKIMLTYPTLKDLAKNHSLSGTLQDNLKIVDTGINVSSFIQNMIKIGSFIKNNSPSQDDAFKAGESALKIIAAFTNAPWPVSMSISVGIKLCSVLVSDFVKQNNVNHEWEKICNLFDDFIDEEKGYSFYNDTEVPLINPSEKQDELPALFEGECPNFLHQKWTESEQSKLADDIDILYNIFKFYRIEDSLSSISYPPGFYDFILSGWPTEFYAFVMPIFEMGHLCSGITEIFDYCLFYADICIIIKQGDAIHLHFVDNASKSSSLVATYSFPFPIEDKCKDIKIRFIAFKEKPLYYSPWYTIQNIDCGNNSPTVSITAPSNNSVYNEGEYIEFIGSGYDDEDGTLEGNSLAWSSNIDGDLGIDSTISVNDLSVGEHTIILTATDSCKAIGTDSITINVIPLNTLPSVGIDNPANNSYFTEGSVITFKGWGNDEEDGQLDGNSLVWSSNIDGEIGKGNEITSDSLSVGTHTISLTAIDSQNETNSTSVTITVNIKKDYPDQIIKAINVGYGPGKMAVTPDGKYVYVINSNSNSISIIQTSDNTVTNTINLSCPAGITIGPNGNYVYVGSSCNHGFSLR